MRNADINIFDLNDYKMILEKEYEVRSVRRARYSMRAFSRDLGLNINAYNDIINGRYGLSVASAQKIATALGYNEKEKAYFICLVESQHSRGIAARKAAQARLLKYRHKRAFKAVRQDQFELLSKWYYLPILELVSILDGRLDAKICARHLELSENETEMALQILKKHGFIEFVDQRWQRRAQYSAFDTSTPSTTIRAFHRQVLEQALKSIEEQSIDERAVYSTILSFSQPSVEKAKSFLQKTQSDFIENFEVNEKADSVYALSFQLFRLDKGNK